MKYREKINLEQALKIGIEGYLAMLVLKKDMACEIKNCLTETRRIKPTYDENTDH